MNGIVPDIYIASNNFKFGATQANMGQNPTPNFFGLPLLANNSQNIIEYYLKFDNFDPVWWPTDGNCVDLFRFYLRSGNQGDVLDPDYHRVEIFCDMARISDEGNYVNAYGVNVPNTFADEI